MKTKIILLIVTALLTSPSISITASASAAEPIKTLAEWNGKVADIKLRSLLPESGCIVDPDTLSKVWKAWSGKKSTPEIDFTKDIILVGTAPGPNRVMMRPMQSDDGNINFMVASTKMGGPGFGYKMVQVSRSGVTKVKGKSLPAVYGNITIPKGVESFEGHDLEIKLFEYDPRLADVGATLVDEMNQADFSHENDEVTQLFFSLGSELAPRDDRNYYVTIFVLKDGKRTHIGEKDGKNGLGKVLGPNPPSIDIIVRPVR